VRRILEEPLIHFLLGGALLFVLFAWKSRGTQEPVDEIVVSPAQVEVLASGWSRIWQRPPTPDEVERIIDEYIREEVYYREALKLGLERDDTIIRRRLRQKMEFLAEDFYQENDPGDKELQRFLDAHADEFRKPAVLTFQHIYFSPDLRGDSASDDARRALAELTPESDSTAVEALGDPFFLEREFKSSSEAEIARVLGGDFVPKLLALIPGEWSGPLQPGFGCHLVQVTDRIEGRVPALEEIREAVLQSWQSAEREKYAEEFYQQLRAQYSVTVEMPETLNQPEPSEARR
jgi:hypothetical protein